MTTRDLWDAIGLVEDPLVLEADEAATQKPPHSVSYYLRRCLPLAACLAVFVGTFLVWQKRVANTTNSSSTAMAGGAQDTGDANPVAPQAQSEEVLEVDGERSADSSPADLADGSESPETCDIREDPFDTQTEGGDQALHIDRSSNLPDEVTAALRNTGAGGSYALLAYSAEDLYYMDPVLLAFPAYTQSGDLPETLPVFRSMMADHATHEAEMQNALAQVLEGLGLDASWAEKAELTFGNASLAEWNQMCANEQDSKTGLLDTEHEYWAGAASLTLEDDEELNKAGVERIRVSNDLTVSIFFLAGEDAEPDLVTDRDDAVRQSADIQKKHSELLRAMGADDAAIEGGDYDIYGEQAGVFTAFYGKGKEDGAYPAFVESLLNLKYKDVLVSSNADGALSTVHWNAAGPGTLLGEYPVIDHDRALDLLYRGQYIAPVDDPAGSVLQQKDAIVRTRITYTDSGAAYHVPVWEFMVEAGPVESASDAAAGLKEYRFYYVPAVDIETLQTWIGQEG